MALLWPTGPQLTAQQKGASPSPYRFPLQRPQLPLRPPRHRYHALSGAAQGPQAAQHWCTLLRGSGCPASGHVNPGQLSSLLVAAGQLIFTYSWPKAPGWGRREFVPF
ncbi:hypothetical protein NDU88_004255 [Pleurodeles waltl]|uniref:Uncharacterized protein n=1 Tax=Pleurodeles waltl TaxID=8319 RepID=A0AAV7WXN6_PLEWA|nr:hypothetical protein NDU88_004255 [Pleurodeles waltl]